MGFMGAWEQPQGHLRESKLCVPFREIPFADLFYGEDRQMTGESKPPGSSVAPFWCVSSNENEFSAAIDTRDRSITSFDESNGRGIGGKVMGVVEVDPPQLTTSINVINTTGINNPREGRSKDRSSRA